MMLTIDEIKYVGFRKSSIGGYKPEDVDKFIDEVIESYKSLMDKNTELMEKVDMLNEQNLKYQEDEELIRGALINAQKLSDASLREAKHKAEVIIKDATDRAENIILEADEKVKGQIRDYENLKKEINNFKTELLNSYKKHLKLIDALPSKEEINSNNSEAINDEDYKECSEDRKERKEDKSEPDNTSIDKTENDIGFEFSMSKSMDDLKYDIKFGDDYNIENDKDSPIGLFKS